VYEALLRERMDADQSEQFDADLEISSSVEGHALDPEEKAEMVRRLGGEVG
jgi:hypothetical protein